MTRPNAIVVVSVASLIFAGLASWGVYNYLQKETQKSKATPSERIIVAAADLPVGTKLNATQIKLAAWPRENKPQGSIPDAGAVADRVVVRQIFAGEPITEQKLLPKDVKASGGMMTYVVPDGHRAITVGVNEVAGVAGFLAPGNHVDVVLTTQLPGATSENISKIILQDVPVLATGQISTDQKAEGKPVVVPTVTLDLTPDNAEKLVLAASKGSLQLLLRNVTDVSPVTARGATISKVLTGMETRPLQVSPQGRQGNTTKTKTVQAKRSVASGYTVEVIEGTNRSLHNFGPLQ